jgi:hypothetical protein
MHGFIQERAAIQAVRKVNFGPTFLYSSYSHHEQDFIYSEGLKQWEKERAISQRSSLANGTCEKG